MTSYQSSGGTGKAAKFVTANPLGPMIDPFAGLNDSEKDYPKLLSENVNARLQKALDDLKENHSVGQNYLDEEDRARVVDQCRTNHKLLGIGGEEIQTDITEGICKEAVCFVGVKGKKLEQHGDGGQENESESEDEYDELLNRMGDDPELEIIRKRRMEEIRQAHIKHAENLGKGHGQYRHIYQDNFLPECTGSEFVAVHFSHKDFERCRVMDQHLERISRLHISCKFVKIDAEKAPFFVHKLKVKTLPTLIVFQDGKVVDRLTGFEGLAQDKAHPDSWHTSRLQLWLSKTGAIDYKKPDEEMLDEMRRHGIESDILDE